MGETAGEIIVMTIVLINCAVIGNVIGLLLFDKYQSFICEIFDMYEAGLLAIIDDISYVVKCVISLFRRKS